MILPKLIFSIYDLITCLIAKPLVFIISSHAKTSYEGREKELLGYVLPKDYKNPVWFHTVSVGEALGAYKLIRDFQQKYPNIPIIQTTTTPTGAEIVKNKSPDIQHLYAPLDSSYAVNRFVNIVKPRLYISMETELWPILFNTLNKQNIPIIIINARLSEHSYIQYAKFKSCFKNLISDKITLVSVQTKEDKQRFIKLGIAENKIKISGSLKYDLTVNQNQIKNGCQIRTKYYQKRKILMAASTHPGEEKLILNAFKIIKQQIPNALLILAPRHPERFNDVEKLSISMNFKTIKRTQETWLENTDVIISDSMGEMFMYFAMSDVVFMAGSLTGIGGHNPLEPAAVPKAIITGPDIHNFEEIFNKLSAAGSAFIENKDTWYKKAIALLNSSEDRKKAEEAGLSVILQNQGAVKKTISYIEQVM